MFYYFKYNILKIVCFLIYLSAIIDCFKLIYLNNLISNKKLNNSIINLKNNLKPNRLINKRSLSNVNNIFKDNDENKNTNTDYFDFTGLYKDEIKERNNLDQYKIKNNRRQINDDYNSIQLKKRKRKRRRKRKYKANRFKRKDDLDNRLRRISLKPSFNKFNLNNENQISPQKKLISLQYEDHFHHLIMENKSLDEILKDHLKSTIKSKNPINNIMNVGEEGKHLNKILDNLIYGKVSLCDMYKFL